jgi:hypothetical protein
MNSSSKSAEHFFSASGGVVAPTEGDGDPFAALDDLMVVVEAMCPTWPQRDTFESTPPLQL